MASTSKRLHGPAQLSGIAAHAGTASVLVIVIDGDEKTLG